MVKARATPTAEILEDVVRHLAWHLRKLYHGGIPWPFAISYKASRKDARGKPPGKFYISISVQQGVAGRQSKPLH
jgi:hypothetical protein